MDSSDDDEQSVIDVIKNAIEKILHENQYQSEASTRELDIINGLKSLRCDIEDKIYEKQAFISALRKGIEMIRKETRTHDKLFGELMEAEQLFCKRLSKRHRKKKNDSVPTDKKN